MRSDYCDSYYNWSDPPLCVSCSSAEECGCWELPPLETMSDYGDDYE